MRHGALWLTLVIGACGGSKDDDAPATAEEKVKADVVYGLEVKEKEQIFTAVLPRET